MDKDSKLDFSVIVLCYNPDYNKLKRTLMSIFHQKKVTFEVIISDDGSTIDYKNELLFFLNKIKPKNISVRLNFLRTNLGTIQNYLSAIILAKGKYIKPISPGDYLFDVLSLFEYKIGFDNDKYNIIFSDCVYYSNNKVIKNTTPYNNLVYHEKSLLNNYCIYRDYIVGATLCVNRKFAERIYKKCASDVSYLEDKLLCTVSLLNGELIHGIRKPLIWYEYGNGQTTAKKISQHIIQDEQKLYKYLERYYKNNKTFYKMTKYCKICECNNLFKKFILMLILFPKYYLHKILHFISGPKKYKISLDFLDYITREDINGL